MTSLGLAASLALALAVALLSTEARAQTTEDFQVWTAVLGTADLTRETPGPSLWLDVHARRSDAGTVHIVRPGAGLRIAPWISVWAGYAWVPVSRDATDDVVHEHRIWEQVILQHAFDFRLSLQARTRLEQRFSEAGSDVGLRLRQLVRAGWQFVPDVPLGVVVWDELFVGFADTDWGARGGFDQNRLFAGLFLQMAPFARLELGYLFLYVERGDADLVGHALGTNLFVAVAP